MTHDRFWLWFIPLNVVAFGIICGGVIYDMTLLGYDPLSSSAQSSQSFYIYNDGTEYRIIADGHNLPFSTNLPLNLQENTCYGITFQGSIVTQHVSATINPVDSYYCEPMTTMPASHLPPNLP